MEVFAINYVTFLGITGHVKETVTAYIVTWLERKLAESKLSISLCNSSISRYLSFSYTYPFIKGHIYENVLAM